MNYFPSNGPNVILCRLSGISENVTNSVSIYCLAYSPLARLVMKLTFHPIPPYLRYYTPQIFPKIVLESPGCRLTNSMLSFYRAMHFSAYARSWDRMSSVRPSVCNVGGL